MQVQWTPRDDIYWVSLRHARLRPPWLVNMLRHTVQTHFDTARTIKKVIWDCTSQGLDNRHAQVSRQMICPLDPRLLGDETQRPKDPLNDGISLQLIQNWWHQCRRWIRQFDRTRRVPAQLPPQSSWQWLQYLSVPWFLTHTLLAYKSHHYGTIFALLWLIIIPLYLFLIYPSFYRNCIKVHVSS